MNPIVLLDVEKTVPFARMEKLSIKIIENTLDEESVDYPMGVRQSATIIFAEDLGRRSEKKLKELENGKDTAGGKDCITIAIKTTTTEKQQQKNNNNNSNNETT